jgi:hypothetical protein
MIAFIHSFTPKNWKLACQVIGLPIRLQSQVAKKMRCLRSEALESSASCTYSRSAASTVWYS